MEVDAMELVGKEDEEDREQVDTLTNSNEHAIN